MEDEILEAVVGQPDRFQNCVDRAIDRLFGAVPLAVVHALGSDFCHYRGFDRLPLTGEALPMGYEGTVAGVRVLDRIRHEKWVSVLPKDVFITLELMMRPDYDYLQQIKRNRSYLEGLIKTTV
jgi:hypothetical protein